MQLADQLDAFVTVADAIASLKVTETDVGNECMLDAPGLKLEIVGAVVSPGVGDGPGVAVGDAVALGLGVGVDDEVEVEVEVGVEEESVVVAATVADAAVGRSPPRMMGLQCVSANAEKA